MFTRWKWNKIYCGMVSSLYVDDDDDDVRNEKKMYFELGSFFFFQHYTIDMFGWFLVFLFDWIYFNQIDGRRGNLIQVTLNFQFSLHKYQTISIFCLVSFHLVQGAFLLP